MREILDVLELFLGIFEKIKEKQGKVEAEILRSR